MEEKLNKVEKYMRKTLLKQLSGNVNFLYKVQSVGVKNRVQYYNAIEKITGKVGSLFGDVYLSEVIETVHDNGLIFNDGTEIRNIDHSVFNYFNDKQIILKRERL